jgi:hypothetical protein
LYIWKIAEGLDLTLLTKKWVCEVIDILTSLT